MYSMESLTILLFILFLNKVSGNHSCCKYIKIIRLLDCVGCSLEKVPVIDEHDMVVTLDLRGNNITWIDDETILAYKNLNVIDLRQNPQVCGKIKTLNVEVKSDCHSTPTSDVYIYHTPQLSTRADSSTIPTHRNYKTSPSTPFHKKPSTTTHQLFYTTHLPNTIISQTHNRSREIAISLSAFVSTLLLLYITIRLKRFLCCCWRDRHRNTDEVISMNFTTSSSSGSSTTIYSDSSV